MGRGLTGLALALLLIGGAAAKGPPSSQGGRSPLPEGAARYRESSSPSSQAPAQRRELVRIQKELEKTRAELEEFRKQAAALSLEARKLASRDGETLRRISVIQSSIRQAETKRAQLKSRMAALSRASGFWTSVLAAELRGHALSLAGCEEAWGGRQLWAQALRRAALLEKARMIASFRGYRIKTEAAVEAARRKAAELEDKGRRARAEERSVRQEYERKQAAAAEARERAAAAEKKARELEETKLALARLLNRIGGAGRYERQGQAARLDIPKNSLPWPVDGSVARPFGRERNTELNTWIIREGVTFAAPSGAAVAAIGSGRVIYAGPFRSYGQVVILDHGEGFFSVYGELGEIRKAKGADVATGECVGTAGGEGGRGAVYLELRRGTEALDPMAWLRKK